MRPSPDEPRVVLERALARYVYTPGPKEDAVERMRYPSMAEIFLRMTSAHGGLPPSQRDFALVVAWELGVKPGPAVLARAGRTWASFVVQLHAKVTLEEQYPYVSWEPRADVEYGLDVIVYGKDWEPVALRLRVGTPAGDASAVAKNGRSLVSGLVTRELTTDPHEHRVGPFWLFSPVRLFDAVEDALWEARGRRATEHDDLVYGVGFQEGRAAAERGDL